MHHDSCINSNTIYELFMIQVLVEKKIFLLSLYTGTNNLVQSDEIEFSITTVTCNLSHFRYYNYYKSHRKK